MRFKTVSEACKHWVRGFNAIHQDLIVKAYKDSIDDIREVTPITEGDRVWSNDLQDEVEVIAIDSVNNMALIVDSNENEIKVDLCKLSHDYDSWLPMWGTMWTFGDTCDNWWLEKHLQDMADCGFRIFESDEIGYFFGIDGAGYDFYTSHWIPLYLARGLKWHEFKLENQCELSNKTLI